MEYMTRTDIKRNYSNIIRAPYCALGTLGNSFEKVGYNSGGYGWNYDVLEITPDTCVLTGYRVPKSICTAELSASVADKLLDDFMADAAICTAWKQLADKMPDYAERIIAAAV